MDVVEALVFGELTYRRNGVCFVYVFGTKGGDRLCEPSQGPPASDGPSEPARTTTDQPAPADEVTGGNYQATISDFSSANGLAVGSTSSNMISIDLSGAVPEMSLSYDVRLAPDNYADDADVVCQLDLDFDAPNTPLDGATFNGEGWSGQLAVSLGVFDGTCPGGSTDNATLTGSLDVTFSYSESTVSGTLEGGGDVLSFSGGLVS